MRKIIFTIVALLSVAAGLMAQGRDTIIIRDTVYIEIRKQLLKTSRNLFQKSLSGVLTVVY